MARDTDVLERAWRFREAAGWLESGGALRIFYGPHEGRGSALARYAIDRFGDFYWVTEWERAEGEGAQGGRPASEGRHAQGGSQRDSDGRREEILARTEAFLRAQGAIGGVRLPRPKRGQAEESYRWFGEVPDAPIEAREGELRFKIKLVGVKHPGLFLDHQPLREWLRANSRGRSVLNCFAYTGSLSVAAGVGGASAVTTLDLSNPTIRWAEENWTLNGLSLESATFIADDVFDRLPRLTKKGARFDCVILDPPSFSRGTKGNFSTARDLPRLHRLALDGVTDGGVLVTSINSANVSRAKYEAEVRQAAREAGAELEVIEPIALPERFAGPRAARAGEDYLKGWVFRVRRATRRS